MWEIPEMITEPKHIAPNQMQETIYVLMCRQGMFLCTRLDRYHCPIWNRQIALALQAGTVERLQARIKNLLDKISDVRQARFDLGEAILCAATITLEPVPASSTSAMSLATDNRDIRRDFVRRITDAGHAHPAYHSFSTKGRWATRPSKAVGCTTESWAGAMAEQRIIQLTHLDHYRYQ